MTQPNLVPENVATSRWRALVLPASIVIIVVIALVATTAIVHANYQGRILPHVRVAGIALAGLDQGAATQRIQEAFDAMLADGLTVDTDGRLATIALYPATGAGGDVAFSLIDVNAADLAARAMDIGRSDNQVLSAIGALGYASVLRANLPADVTVDETRLAEAIREAFTDGETEEVATDFDVTITRDEVSVEVVPGIAGVHFAIASAMDELRKDAKDLTLETLAMRTVTEELDVSVAEAETLAAEAADAVNAAPYVVNATLSGGEPKTWSVKAADVAEWIVPGRDAVGNLLVLLDPASTAPFIGTLHDALDVPAQNARFNIENGRVVEFAGSESGTVVDDQVFFEIGRAHV